MRALISLLALVAAVVTVRAGKPPADALAASDRIVAAMVSGDYAEFVADSEPAFANLPESGFQSVVAQLAARFASGYTVTYLGELRQKGYQVTLWRFAFDDGGDDMLGTLSLKGGKVGGYWIQGLTRPSPAPRRGSRRRQPRTR